MNKGRSDRILFLSLAPFSFILVGLMALFLFVLVNRSWESLAVFDGSILTRNLWDPENEGYGVLGPLLGTLITSGIATIIALALSIPLSIFIVDFLKGPLREVFASVIEMMGGMPTIIYAIWAMWYFAPVIKEALLDPLHQYLGFIPLFSCTPLAGFSVLTAGIVIGISLVPYSTAIISESYRMLPATYREACLGIGATRYEATRILMSLLKPAIIASALLSFARGAGETTIAVATVGNAMSLGTCIIGPGYTISALIASQYANAGLYRYAESVLYFGALVVLAITLLASLAGLVLLEKWRVRVVV